MRDGADMTNHNRNMGERTHGRKVNQYNKDIVNFITSLPVGEYEIIVQGDDEPLVKYEGSMVLYKNNKCIHIVRGRL